METTEKIVDSYCKYVREWFTMSNIKCPGQYEIDLLAIDPISGKRYHIECGISISGSFSKLTSKEFSHQQLKVRTEQASQRRTIGYFIQRKFGPQEVLSKLRRYGFKDGNYTKVIVTWGWTEGAKSQAIKNGIELWDFRNIMYELYKEFAGAKTYFIDDTMRTIQLFTKAMLQKPVFGFKRLK
jgi:hypothetical protein